MREYRVSVYCDFMVWARDPDHAVADVTAKLTDAVQTGIQLQVELVPDPDEDGSEEKSS